MKKGTENIKGQGFHTDPDRINKEGRPKGFKGMTATLRDILEKDGSMILENIIELDENKKETGNIIRFGKVNIPKGEMIILAAARKALKGDMRAIEFITDRTEGKAKQSIEFEDKTPKADLNKLTKETLEKMERDLEKK